MMLEGHPLFIPADSGSGTLGQPHAIGESGGTLTGLETLYANWLNIVPDPDEAMAQDPDVLSKLHNQADVMQCMQKRAMTVRALPWKVQPNPYAEDKAVAQKIADYAAQVFDGINTLRDFIQQCQNAILPGGVGHEWMWQIEADGTERPVESIAIHKTRLLYDRLGNILLRTRTDPVFGVYLGANPGNEALARGLPAGKITYWAYEKIPGEWNKPELEGYRYWGRGLDVPLYYCMSFDQYILRFQMKWLEQYGLPPKLIYYPNTTQAGEKAQIQAVARSLAGNSVTSIPRDVGAGNEYSRFKIETLDVPSPSYDAFNQFYQIRTKPAINGIILGSSDEMAQGEGGGGYASHQSRRDAGPMVLYKADAENINQTINRQLMPAIFKRGPRQWRNLPWTYLPRFQLIAEEEKDRLQEATILETVTRFLSIVEDEAYDRVGFKKPSEDDKTIGGAPLPGEENPFDTTGKTDKGAGAGLMRSPIGEKKQGTDTAEKKPSKTTGDE